MFLSGHKKLSEWISFTLGFAKPKTLQEKDPMRKQAYSPHQHKKHIVCILSWYMLRRKYLIGSKHIYHINKKHNYDKLCGKIYYVGSKHIAHITQQTHNLVCSTIWLYMRRKIHRILHTNTHIHTLLFRQCFVLLVRHLEVRWHPTKSIYNISD